MKITLMQPCVSTIHFRRERLGWLLNPGRLEMFGAIGAQAARVQEIFSLFE
jgi:hypothetical protein